MDCPDPCHDPENPCDWDTCDRCQKECESPFQQQDLAQALELEYRLGKSQKLEPNIS